VQQGAGVKLGRFVFINGFVVLSTKGTITGTLVIGNLPYPVEPYTFPTGTVNWLGLPTAFVTMVGVGVHSTSTMSLRGAAGAAQPSSNTPLTGADVADGSGFTFWLMYLTTETGTLAAGAATP